MCIITLVQVIVFYRYRGGLGDTDYHLPFNVPQVKQRMFLYKFAECRRVRTLTVDQVNPLKASGDRLLMGLRYDW
jgi:hypothetical protein